MMKKVLYFAAIAAITLPMLISCNKSKNEPNDPNHPEFESMEEAFEYWMEPNEGEGVEINELNLLGSWILEIDMFVLNSTDQITGWNPLYNIERDEYMELTADKYFYHVVDPILAAETLLDYTAGWYDFPARGTDEHDWALEEDKIILKNTEGSKYQEMKVYALEKNRLVLTCPDGPDKTRYMSFTRVAEVPKLVTIRELLTGNSWRITKDSLVTSEGSFIGAAEPVKIIGGKSNLLPSNLNLTFKTKEEYGEGELIISQGKLDNELIRVDVNIDYDMNRTGLILDMPEHSPIKLDKYWSFVPFSNLNSGILWTEGWDQQNNYQTYILYLGIMK